MGACKKQKKSNGRSPSIGTHDKKPIDWSVVRKLCAIQCTANEIAGFLEMHIKTLARACKEMYGMTPDEKFSEWREGGKCSLRRKQWHLAETNAALAIFLGKQYLGQDDDYNVHHSGSIVQVVHFGDGEPKKWEGNGQETEKE